MSNWTYVAGIIRIDYIKYEDKPILDFDKLLGRDCDCIHEIFEANKHPELYLPVGSVGSLKKSIWVSYPNDPYIARYAVSIFGDLCDYSCDRIIEWFKNKCKLTDSDKVSGSSIIQATITVSNEYGDAKSYTYKKEEE